MPSKRGPRNTILKGHVRRFNLAKCNLPKCNNFITSLNYKIPRLCGNHLINLTANHRLKEFTNIQLIKDYSETKPRYAIQWQKLKHIKDHKRI